jgi:hypothetical protein
VDEKSVAHVHVIHLHSCSFRVRQSFNLKKIRVLISSSLKQNIRCFGVRKSTKLLINISYTCTSGTLGSSNPSNSNAANTTFYVVILKPKYLLFWGPEILKTKGVCMYMYSMCNTIPLGSRNSLNLNRYDF